MKKNPPITAAELMNKLEHDPEWVARSRRGTEKLAANAREHALAERPVVEDLRRAGARVDSVWDLVNTPGSYPELVPVLLAHLDRPYPDRVREGIARALAVPEARQGWDTLVRGYLDSPDRTSLGVKWALHLAIAAAADTSTLDTLVALVRNRRHGPNRTLFVDALVRIGGREAQRVLTELAGDPELTEALCRAARNDERADASNVVPSSPSQASPPSLTIFGRIGRHLVSAVLTLVAVMAVFDVGDYLLHPDQFRPIWGADSFGVTFRSPATFLAVNGFDVLLVLLVFLGPVCRPRVACWRHRIRAAALALLIGVHWAMAGL